MSDENKRLTPVWIVYVDGKRLDTKHEGALIKITVNDKLNGIGTCSLFFDNSFVKVRDEGLISFESEVSVHLGYKDSVNEVFFGEVTGFKIDLQEYGNEQLVVRLHSVLHNLDHGKHYCSYNEKAHSKIIAEIFEKYGIQAEVEQFGVKKAEIAQQNETDYDFLMKNAAQYGMFVYTKGKKVCVNQNITENKEDLIFEWGKSLVSVETREDISRLIDETTVIGLDMLKGESFVSKATLQDIPVQIGGGKMWNEHRRGPYHIETLSGHEILDSEEAKQIAIGNQQLNSFLYGKGIGKIEGNNKVFPGNRVSIKYIGEVFSGEYLIDSVFHSFDQRNGYKTEFTMMRNMMPGESTKKAEENKQKSEESMRNDIRAN